MPEFPALQVSAEDGDWQEGRGGLLLFTTCLLGQFSQTSGRPLYKVCEQVRNIRLLQDISQHQCTGVLGDDSSVNFKLRVSVSSHLPRGQESYSGIKFMGLG